MKQIDSSVQSTSKLKQFLSKYSHAWVLLYIFIYFPWFTYLEKHVTEYTLIHVPLDDIIPFCEYFIVPYFLWFFYVAATIVYEFFYSKQEFYRCCAFLFSGMTLFLVICTVWHNGLDLRLDNVSGDNIFSKMVLSLYKTDTSTNVFPSIHVFNSLGCMIALFKTKGLSGNKPWKIIIKVLVAILSVSIVLSTMFLKQHSVVDAIGGIVLATLLYFVFYFKRPFKENEA